MECVAHELHLLAIGVVVLVLDEVVPSFRKKPVQVVLLRLYPGRRQAYIASLYRMRGPLHALVDVSGQ